MDAICTLKCLSPSDGVDVTLLHLIILENVGNDVKILGLFVARTEIY